jgi:hypothetical protein
MATKKSATPNDEDLHRLHLLLRRVLLHVLHRAVFEREAEAKFSIATRMTGRKLILGWVDSVWGD